MFTLKGLSYIVIADYFSCYLEVIQLRTTTTPSVVSALKSLFSRHDIPETVMSDNGPQFISLEFAEFATRYHFKHITSSPLYLTSNGQAERSVKTVKHLLRNAEDPFLALLAYQATPMPWCGKSPAELLMGRSLRSTVPQTNNQLVSSWSYLQDFRACNAQLTTTILTRSENYLSYQTAQT